MLRGCELFIPENKTQLLITTHFSLLFFLIIFYMVQYDFGP